MKLIFPHARSEHSEYDILCALTFEQTRCVVRLRSGFHCLLSSSVLIGRVALIFS